jgi:hypothetical protein
MIPEPTLTPRELRFVRARLVHPKLEDVAKESGIGLRTARRYSVRPHIRAAVEREALTRLRATTTALARYAERAVDALGQSACGDLPASPAKVRAAVAIVELSLRAVEVEDLAQRLDALEKAAAVKSKDTYQ